MGPIVCAIINASITNRPTQVIGERYILEYIPFYGVETYIFDERSWWIKVIVAFTLVLMLLLIVCFIYACDCVLRPLIRTGDHKKDYTEIL